MKILYAMILSLIATAALATNHTPTPPSDPSTSATSSSVSHGGNATATGGRSSSTSGAISGSSSSVKNSGNSSSTAVGVGGAGGSVKSSGNSNVKTDNTNVGVNEQGQKQGQQQEANNEGNSLSVVNEDVRQAPSVAQGSLVLATCGFGGNAGGSRSSGSAFLGLEIKTAGCWDAEQIANEAALGHYKTACELNRLTAAGKRNMARLKAAGITPEPCSLPVPVPALDASDLATKDYVGESVTRAFKQSQTK